MITHGYDVTYKPRGDTGGPPRPHMLPVRWWQHHTPQLLDSAALPAQVRVYAGELTREVPAPHIHRVPLFDAETVPAEHHETVISEYLFHLRGYTTSKCLIAFWNPGKILEWPYQRALAALDAGYLDPAYSKEQRAADRATIRATCRRVRPIVQAAGVVVHNAVIDTPAQFDFFMRKTRAWRTLMRAQYPGTELCAWLVGSYVRSGGELSREHCAGLIDTIWNGWDSFALYGVNSHNARLGDMLAARLEQTRAWALDDWAKKKGGPAKK